MAQSSRTFRIFVSSTFSDLKAERNALQEKVFPRLRDLAMAHGCRFQAIDLRWGVSEEAALDQQTMKICLGEIERSQKTSPRPNFIVLLGDRYGWRPLPYEIPAKEFEDILLITSREDQTILKQWYRRDDNAIPPVYDLQPRTGEFKKFEVWEKVENQLHSIFQEVVGQLSLSQDAQLKYTASATEQEIYAGALKVTDAKEHVFCFFRGIQDMPEGDNAATFYEADPTAASMQTELKKRLRETLSVNVHEYNTTWQGDRPSLDHLTQLCSDVYKELSVVIISEVGRLDDIDPLEREIEAHKIFGAERSRVFIGRTEILNTIEKYISSDKTHPFVIWGASGSGKSALMAKAIEQTQKNRQEVIHRFIGATPESSNGRALLESLCKQISQIYNFDAEKRKHLEKIEKKIFGTGSDSDKERQEQLDQIEKEFSVPSDFQELSKTFSKFINMIPSNRRLIVFLDALDQLSVTDNALNLRWLPFELPPNVRLIVSSLSGECMQVLESKVPALNRLELHPMLMEDGEAILRVWFKKVHRKLEHNQEQYLLDKFKDCGLPLYLKLAFEEAKLWKSYDLLPELSDDIPGILQDLFKRLSHESTHGEMLVSRSLGYLTAAKNGLSEDELMDVLSMDQEMLADFQRRSPKSPKVNQLPVVVWSRLYFDLEPYLIERRADNMSLLAFYHTTSFKTVIMEKYLSGQEKTSRHITLANYFGNQPLYRMTEGMKKPNLRKLTEMVYHQAFAELSMQVEKTLLDYSYLEAKLVGQGVQKLIEDYALVPKAGVSKGKEKLLSLLQETLRLSAHVVSKDPLQLASQLTGRLLGFEESDLAELLAQIRRDVKHPWLRPLHACFDAPGGSLIRTLVGHSGKVNSVALTPDGRHAVSASDDKTIKVWDLQSGDCLRTLEGHEYSINCVVLTSDGHQAVSASDDETLKVWNLESGVCLHTLKGHTNIVKSVTLNPDNDRVISVSDDKTLKVWDLGSGICLLTLEGHTDIVKSVAMTPDGRHAVSASYDKTIKVWDIRSGSCLCTQELPFGMDVLALTPDGRQAILENVNGTLEVWDIEGGACLRTLEAHQEHLENMALMPDSHNAVSFSWDEPMIKVWDLESGACLRILEGHTDGVNCVALTKDGHHAISASDDYTLKIWDLERDSQSHLSARHSGAVNSVALTPNGHRAVSVSIDGTLKVWNLEDGSCSRTIEVHSGILNDVALTPDGLYAISAADFPTISVFDLKSGACLRTLEGHAYSINSVTLTLNSRLVISASSHSLKVWNFKSGACLRTLAGLNTVALTPDGSRAISASDDGKFKVWDLKSGACKRTLELYSGMLNHVALTPDSRRAVSASDEKLRVWDLENGSCLCTIEGHTDKVNDVALMPDGCHAISASTDKTLRVWDLESGFCIATLYCGCEMRCVGITPGGFYLVAGDSNGSVYFFQTENILGPSIITSWRFFSPFMFWKQALLAFGCPHCHTWSEISRFVLGTEIPCPNCGKPIKLNSFTIEGDWHPIAKAWQKGE